MSVKLTLESRELGLDNHSEQKDTGASTDRASSLIARARALLERITPGPWQVIEDCYEPSEKFGQLAGKVAQRRIFTAWDHPQLKGPYGVVNSYTTIAKVCGEQPHRGVSIHDADAEFIAAAPQLVADLCTALEGLSAPELRQA